MVDVWKGQVVELDECIPFKWNHNHHGISDVLTGLAMCEQDFDNGRENKTNKHKYLTQTFTEGIES